jgi:hypothetical protein
MGYMKEDDIASAFTFFSDSQRFIEADPAYARKFRKLLKKLGVSQLEALTHYLVYLLERVAIPQDDTGFYAVFAFLLKVYGTDGFTDWIRARGIVLEDHFVSRVGYSWVSSRLMAAAEAYSRCKSREASRPRMSLEQVQSIHEFFTNTLPDPLLRAMVDFTNDLSETVR